jgi:hypothetical protein
LLVDHTEREIGRILLPDERDEKTGDTVLKVLESKHPDARVLDASNFKAYEICPELVDLNIKEEVCCKVTQRQHRIRCYSHTTIALEIWQGQYGTSKGIRRFYILDLQMSCHHHGWHTTEPSNQDVLRLWIRVC